MAFNLHPFLYSILVVSSIVVSSINSSRQEFYVSAVPFSIPLAIVLITSVAFPPNATRASLAFILQAFASSAFKQTSYPLVTESSNLDLYAILKSFSLPPISLYAINDLALHVLSTQLAIVSEITPLFSFAINETLFLISFPPFNVVAVSIASVAHFFFAAVSLAVV